MELFLSEILNESSSSENSFSRLDIQKWPFLRNINEPTNFSFSSAHVSDPTRGTKGPIFEDEPNFDLAFKLFHGRDGIVHLSGKPEPAPQFNPLAGKALALVSQLLDLEDHLVLISSTTSGRNWARNPPNRILLQRSFLCGGSTGLFIYGYCLYDYHARSDMSGFMQTSFFFGTWPASAMVSSSCSGWLGSRHPSSLFATYTDPSSVSSHSTKCHCTSFAGWLGSISSRNRWTFRTKEASSNFSVIPTMKFKWENSVPPIYSMVLRIIRSQRRILQSSLETSFRT